MIHSFHFLDVTTILLWYYETALAKRASCMKRARNACTLFVPRIRSRDSTVRMAFVDWCAQQEELHQWETFQDRCNQGLKWYFTPWPWTTQSVLAVVFLLTLVLFPWRMRDKGKINSSGLRGRRTCVLEVILIVPDFYEELLREKKNPNKQKYHQNYIFYNAFLTTSR